MTEAIRSSQSGLPGMIRKKNPNLVIGSKGRVWNPALGRWTGTRTIPPPGQERESRLFKMVDGVRTLGSEVMAAEEALGDSAPVPSSTARVRGASTPSGVSSDGDMPSTGTATGSVFAGIMSGLTKFMPVILVVGAVVIGIVVIKSAGNK